MLITLRVLIFAIFTPSPREKSKNHPFVKMVLVKNLKLHIREKSEIFLDSCNVFDDFCEALF